MMEKFGWEQYLIIEEDFIAAKKYINFTQNNYQVDSIFLRNEIVLLGSEIEIAFKKLINYLEPTTDAGNINQYKEKILLYYPNIVNFQTNLLGTEQIFQPYQNWDADRLSFWDSYVNIKHGINNVLATLKLALDMLSAYEIILYFIHAEETRRQGGKEIEYFPLEWPKLLGLYFNNNEECFGNASICGTYNIGMFGRR